MKQFPRVLRTEDERSMSERNDLRFRREDVPRKPRDLSERGRSQEDSGEDLEADPRLRRPRADLAEAPVEEPREGDDDCQLDDEELNRTEMAQRFRMAMIDGGF